MLMQRSSSANSASSGSRAIYRYHSTYLQLVTSNMAYFRITLMRSAIGLPRKTQGVLTALGLRRRMDTVYQPVSADAAGQIMKIKELIDVTEVERKVSRAAMKELRRPDPGFWVETRAADVLKNR